MKDFTDISTWSPKRLRTLRNNLNNRISAFESGSTKELQKSHALFGLEEGECKDLLVKVKKLLVTSK